MGLFYSILATLLEKIGLAWWQRHEKKEATNAANDIDALSDKQLAKRVQLDLVRKD